MKKIYNTIKSNYILLAIVSVIWLIYRTGTKPSRITYPCQQAAIANAGILVYLVPAFTINHLKQKNIFFNKRHKAILIGVGLLIAFFIYENFTIGNLVHKIMLPQPARNYTSPLGIITSDGYKTIPSASNLPSPHRVVSVHNSAASSWSGSGNPHTLIDQAAVDEMFERGLISLTGESTLADAWSLIIPYQDGEEIAIKLNFNNTYADDWSVDPYMNPYAEVINSIIDGLKSIGVPSDKIWLTDPSRIINDSFISRINDPDVKYYVTPSVDLGGRTNVYHSSFVDSTSSYSTVSQAGTNYTYSIRPAQVFIDSEHIINVPQLKAHGGSSLSLGLKNHFGSIFIDDAKGNSPLHNYFYISGSQYGGTEHNIVADISDNPVFKEKTRLVVGDGIMGHSTLNWQNPHTWNSFGGEPPELIFFGVDPIAVDSVMTDFINRENDARGEILRNDDINVYAASFLGLGVFEHWDDSSTRNYSVIDYLEIDIDTLTTVVPAAPSVMSAVSLSSSSLELGWTDNSYNETGFYIERSESSDFSSANVIITGINITNYVDSSLNASTLYYYRVRAYNAIGDSSWSNSDHATTQATPVVSPVSPVLGMPEVVSENSIKLVWTDNSNNEVGFKLERATESDFTDPTEINLQANTVDYADTQLEPGVTYFYRILAYNSVGDSEWSSVIETTTLPSEVQTDDFHDLHITEEHKINIVLEVVEGNGMEVPIEFYEVDEDRRDRLTDGEYNLPVAAVLSGEVVKIEWIATWFEDEGGNDAAPEVQFVVRSSAGAVSSQVLKILKE